MPYRCRECNWYFSVKTQTVSVGYYLPLPKWFGAIYLDSPSLKSVSSMNLHRNIAVMVNVDELMVRRRLRCRGIIADNGSPRGAR